VTTGAGAGDRRARPGAPPCTHARHGSSGGGGGSMIYPSIEEKKL